MFYKKQRFLFKCFLEGEEERISKGRYFMDYTHEGLRSLLGQFDELTILDIWAQEDNTPDRKGRNWINGLVRKE